MRVRSPLRWISILPAVCVLAIAVSLVAGGFHLSLEKPIKESSLQTKDAVLKRIGESLWLGIEKAVLAIAKRAGRGR